MKTVNPSSFGHSPFKKGRILFMILLLAFAGMTKGQEESSVYTSGIESAGTGIRYWLTEKTISRIYIVPSNTLPDKHETAFDMDIRCDAQIKVFEAQLESQYSYIEKWIKYEASSLKASAFLKAAYKIRDSLKWLYDLYPRKELKYLLGIVNAGIGIAEKILNLFR